VEVTVQRNTMDKPLHGEALPILRCDPDENDPVLEGWKIPCKSDQVYAFCYFPDDVYGSADEAHAAAEAWLEQGDAVDAEDTRNVVRIDIDRGNRSSHGWQVRMQRRGQVYTQYFSDSRLGGRRSALKAAQYWRDQTSREAPSAEDPREKSKVSRSQFGIPGMRVFLARVGDNYVPYLQVSWPEQEGRTFKTLSLEKWGPRKATFKLCQVLIQARTEAELDEAALNDPGSPFSVMEPFQSSDPEHLEQLDALYRKAQPAVEKRYNALMSELDKGGKGKHKVRKKKRGKKQDAGATKES